MPIFKIILVTPAPVGTRKGNRITANRWAGLLRQLGHRVVVRQEYAGESCDLLVALHARRSFSSVGKYRQKFPDRPLFVALTGTDIYQDLHTHWETVRSLEFADRILTLQPLAIQELPVFLQSKARVIYQSTVPPAKKTPPRAGLFEVCVVGHLRSVKDPFLTAQASRWLPTSSRVQVLHLGAALSPEFAEEAEREMAANPRYQWLGDLPRWKALRILGRCRLLVQSSLLEGGANTISEAIAAGVPVLSSRISGSVGLLGEDYSGYFPVGDAEALRIQLLKAEADVDFYQRLRREIRKLKPLVNPTRELRTWKALLQDLLD